MRPYKKSRGSARGGALSPAGLPLFDWSQSRSLLEQAPVRHLVQRTRISPALALVYAELFSLGGRK
jgi:hypothetical protein